jgi:hypothetical protein
MNSSLVGWMEAGPYKIERFGEFLKNIAVEKTAQNSLNFLSFSLSWWRRSPPAAAVCVVVGTGSFYPVCVFGRRCGMGKALTMKK